MATLLYKLGRLAFRRRGTMALLWVLIFIGAIFAAASAPPLPADTFTMPGTETQKAYDLLKDKFPTLSADGAKARVVVRAPAGKKLSDPGEKRKVDALVADLDRAPEVVSVVDPFEGQAVSKDGTTGFASVAYEVGATRVSPEAHEALTKAVEDARGSGLTVEMGGDAVPPSQTMGSGEIIGLAVSAVVLFITFGSLLAAGMPLLTAIMGVGVGICGIVTLGSTLGLSSTTSTLALMLGLAVGIDYALFILSRYRAEIAEGREREEAAGRAVGTAGSAVVFAGLTVVVALAGLAVVNVPMLTKMGLAGAATVVVAVLIAITLVPALLGFAPVKVLRRRDRAQQYGKPLSARQRRKDEKLAARRKPNLGTRWARLVLRHPVAILLVGVVGLGAVAVPAASLELGLPSEGTMAAETTQRKAYDMVSDSFGSGYNGPLMVTVEAKDAAAAADRVGKQLGKEKGVVSVSPADANKSGDTAILNVMPSTGPADPRTEDLVKSLRDRAEGIEADTGTRVLVAGQTAMFIDFSETLNEALLPYLALVVGLAFLLLTLVFRSILVPLKAALGFLLSVAAALGAVVAVFQWGWLADVFGVDEPGPVMSTMPIFMIGVVFGLAMDYEVFLVTRMREAYTHGAHTHDAVVTGFQHGGRVVAAAALIMMSVFSGFIMEDNDFIQMIGFGLAIAVLFDAFIVRMALVPALFALLGDSAWWMPKWLDRLLPNMDVEGARLSQLPAPELHLPQHRRETEPHFSD
ncbi:MMPL family transporter [Streptomyces sp. NEAU-H22]|uniref:MMPL family transporter n=1 Tax=unclassified Streptomyces TaxID=2593676 RepID=UPI0022581B17|nr:MULTISPECIES: MMPL family transporter [unclassified Streptomyces]MCX3292491.1 MMPL family transporter [Streptomyces sp. NEAU-H22]WMD05076.1 MMPL family transporter [Streptomyces sp. FXY-T5]